MKPLMILGLFIMALIAAQFAKAQTVDDIVNKYITAMGGEEKLISLKTVKMEGNLTVNGTDVGLIVTRKHLVGMRADISVMGTENYQIVTPAKGIVFMPIRGMTEPTTMSDDELKSSLTQLDIQGSLVDYKQKGTTVEVIGKEKVDTEDCYNLKLTYKSGVVANYYISTTTYYIVKTSGKKIIGGKEMDVTTTYSNYKKNADGYWFPYTTVNSQGETDYSTIDTNKPVDESIFKQ